MLKKHFSKIRVLVLLVGTLIMFYALYFSDKPNEITTVTNNFEDPMLYICLLLSFLCSLLIVYTTGRLNSNSRSFKLYFSFEIIMITKQKALSSLIFILAGQFIALCDWYIFEENSFLILFLASIVGFLISHKGPKKNEIGN